MGRAAYGSPDAGCGDSERPQGQKMEGQSLEEMIAASFFYCFYVQSWPLAASIEEVWIHGKKVRNGKKMKMTNLVEDEEISDVCNI